MMIMIRNKFVEKEAKYSKSRIGLRICSFLLVFTLCASDMTHFAYANESIIQLDENVDTSESVALEESTNIDTDTAVYDDTLNEPEVVDDEILEVHDPDRANDIPDDATEFNGHYYKIIMNCVTWGQAKIECEQLGGHLVTITSKNEQDFIISLNNNGNNLWIGGYRSDSRVDGDWVWSWVTGEKWEYTHWNAGEPNNSSNVVNNENRVVTWGSYWNDLNESNRREQSGYICEWDSSYASLSGPRTDSEGNVTWDCIWYGNYYQTDTNKDGTADKNDDKTPIKWRVLSIDNNSTAFLVSDKVLEAAQFNEVQTDVTWKGSTLRSYLNGYSGSENDLNKNFTSDNFIDSAFSEVEQSSIFKNTIVDDPNPWFKDVPVGEPTSDRIFLLSISEILTPEYGFPSDYGSSNTRVAVVTDYASDKGVRTAGHELGSVGFWWLRTPSYQSDEGSDIDWDGYAYSNGLSPVSNMQSVRPAMYIDLNTADWKSAGVIKSDGTYDESPKKGDNSTKLKGCKNFKVGVDTFAFNDVNNNTKKYWNYDVMNKSQIYKKAWLFMKLAKLENDIGGSGWCYGITAVMGLMYMGKYSPKMYGNVSTVAEIQHSDGIDGLITYYYMLQKLPSVRNLESGSHNELCKRLIQYLRLDNNPCVVRFKATEGGYGHAGLAYALDEDSDPENYLVYVVDPANLRLKRLVEDEFINEPGILYINRNNYHIRYTAGGGKASNYDTDHFLGVIPVNSLYNIVDDAGDVDTIIASTTIPITSFRFSANDVKVDGPYYMARDGEEADVPAFADYYLSPAEDYTVINTEKSDGVFSVIFPKANAFETVNTNAEEFHFSDTGEVSISGATGASELTTMLNEDENITISTEASDLLLSVEDGKCIVKSDEKIGEIGIKIGDGEEKKLKIESDIGKIDVSGEELIYEEVLDDAPVIEANENERKVTLLPGETRRLSVSEEGRYIYGTKWTVTDDNPKGCISVKNGVVKANTLKKGVIQGKATVTALYNGVSVPFEITVDGATPKAKAIEDGKKKYALSATKTLNVSVGSKATVTVGIPAQLRNSKYELEYQIYNKDVCMPKEPKYNNGDRTKASKANVEINPLKAGATYIVWSMTDEKGTTSAVTKVIVNNPINALSIKEKEEENAIELKVGEGRRLTILETIGNTDPKDLTFSVKGKGVKVSKSGFIIAAIPGSKAVVTVKSGKLTDSISVIVTDDYKDKYLAVSKSSVTMSIPKPGSKPTISAVKLIMPRKNQQPVVNWSIAGAPEGISIDQNGKISVNDTASPGSYKIMAHAEGFNTACIELIIK